MTDQTVSGETRWAERFCQAFEAMSPEDIRAEIAKAEEGKAGAVKQFDERIKLLRLFLKAKGAGGSNGSVGARAASAERVAKIKTFLAEHGPATNAEIAAAVGTSAQVVSALLCRRKSDYRRAGHRWELAKPRGRRAK